MSRHKIPTENDTTEFIHGSDHAIGSFLDITDKRFAKSKLDRQGEGYVFEWNSLFGIRTNLIGATLEDMDHSQERMQELVAFGELYEHRIELFIALCRILYDYEPLDEINVWMSKKHSDGTSIEGWFILGLFTEARKQITYYIPMSRFDECTTFAIELIKAPEFDGHTSADVLLRLRKL